MSDVAVLQERMKTHMEDSNRRHENHELRLIPLEDFMKDVRNDLKWVQKIGIGILMVVVSPYAVELFKYLINK